MTQHRRRPSSGDGRRCVHDDVADSQERGNTSDNNVGSAGPSMRGSAHANTDFSVSTSLTNPWASRRKPKADDTLTDAPSSPLTHQPRRGSSSSITNSPTSSSDSPPCKICSNTLASGGSGGTRGVGGGASEAAFCVANVPGAGPSSRRLSFEDHSNKKRKAAGAGEQRRASASLVQYPIANRGDYTKASSEPLFFTALKEAFEGLQAEGRLKCPREGRMPATWSKALEKWADFLANCYMADTRRFHSFGHIMKLYNNSCPVQKVAVLFHDVAYYQVDNGPPPGSAALLDDVLELIPLERSEHIYTVTNTGGGRPKEDCLGLRAAMKVFSVVPGQKLDPTVGLNEFASAVAASRLLLEESDVVPLDLVVDICAIIEATIPFRTNEWSERLYANMLEANKDFGMNKAPEAMAETVRKAVNFANRDVGDFGEEEVLLFLEGTWDLLVENNPSIRLLGENCPMTLWRSALQKSHTFLSTVATNSIFSVFRDTPSERHFARLGENARRNVGLSRIYVGMKFACCVLIESLEGKMFKPARLSSKTLESASKREWKQQQDLSASTCRGDLGDSPGKRQKSDNASTSKGEGGSSSGGAESGPSNSSASAEEDAAEGRDVLRLLRLHRSIKHGRIDEALTRLCFSLFSYLDGEKALGRVNEFIAGVKACVNAKPSVCLKRNEATAVVRFVTSCVGQAFVQEVQDLFGM